MTHYSFLQPGNNRKCEQLKVIAAFGSKQISFVRREVRACTVPAHDLHIGWSSYDKIPRTEHPVAFNSPYEDGHLQSHLTEMGAHSDHQMRHIPMATVPKNGLICLTSFTDEKFSGPDQGAASSTDVFKTRLLAVGNAGIHSVRSTSCQLVRDRSRRDLQKGQEILCAHERLDNLHAQITRQVGEGTRQLQEGILDYVNKISNCFAKNNLYSLESPRCLTRAERVELTMDREEKEEEVRCDSSGEERQGENGEKRRETNQERERTSGEYDEGGKDEKKRKDGNPKRNERNEAKVGGEEEEQTRKSQGEGIKKNAESGAASSSYQHQMSLHPQQEFRQDKDNQTLQTFFEARVSRGRRDFQYPIDSDQSAAKTGHHLGRPSPPFAADNPGAERGATAIVSRRMTWPNINLNLSSSGVLSLDT